MDRQKSRRRRVLRRLAGVVLGLVVLSIGPTALLERWTGLPAAPAIALALVGLAAVLWVTEAIPLFVTSFVILLLELGCRFLQVWKHCNIPFHVRSSGRIQPALFCHILA